MPSRRNLLLTAGGLAATLARPSLLRAATWPDGPLTLIIPWTAGGGTDTIGRALAPVMGELLGTTVTVLNRPGGNGVVGHMQIRQSPHDGLTFGVIGPQLVAAPLLGPTPVTWQDLQPLAMLKADVLSVTVGGRTPWRTLPELLAFARANPEAVRMGNTGQGSSVHIAVLELEKKAGIALTHVPYAGAAPVVRDMLGGHLDATMASAVELRGQVASGDLRMLAVTGRERHRLFPEVPTAAEQGLDVVVSNWSGLALPKGVPEPIQRRLEETVRLAMADPRFTSVMAQQGFDMRFRGIADFTAFLHEADTQSRTYFRS
ncbi:tripartite tricarboxylate transporter substrate binding protein [Roseomonas sp. OT10]|uniref:Bug family tripartite tricarboxylate transporter substrate binding protein n=1 Tax=Roseomonas cutis TaxID=2897332 RepID=UPI001E5A892F|nr:tripartite tricarboxylate transporter substrate binding protein [Roseomonas sp. OT10]UFN49944.1 tripartite tricarboxylate transporter substrate binding protein [Roseomonas sp. OT10]